MRCPIHSVQYIIDDLYTYYVPYIVGIVSTHSDHPRSTRTGVCGVLHTDSTNYITSCYTVLLVYSTSILVHRYKQFASSHSTYTQHPHRTHRSIIGHLTKKHPHPRPIHSSTNTSSQNLAQRSLILGHELNLVFLRYSNETRRVGVSMHRVPVDVLVRFDAEAV